MEDLWIPADAVTFALSNFKFSKHEKNQFGFSDERCL